jgi:hypothetical protein
MALWVTAQNVFTDKNDVADYKVKVGINAKLIWEGTILSHERNQGAAALLHTIADAMGGFRAGE